MTLRAINQILSILVLVTLLNVTYGALIRNKRATSLRQQSIDDDCPVTNEAAKSKSKREIDERTAAKIVSRAYPGDGHNDNDKKSDEIASSVQEHRVHNHHKRELDDIEDSDNLSILDLDDEWDLIESQGSSDDQSDRESTNDNDDSAEPDFQGRFWNGRRIEIERAPWAVSIWRQDPYGNQWQVCSGSFITPQTVITAAHCFGDLKKPFEGGGWFVKYDTSNARTGGKILKAMQVRVYHKFACAVQPNAPHDIGLIFFKDKREGASSKTILSLPLQEDLELLMSDTGMSQLQLTTFGSTYTSEESFVLKEADMYLYRTRCAELGFWADVNVDYNCCPRKGLLITCPGDSGGPYVARAGKWRGKPVIAAIHILGFLSCTEERPFPGNVSNSRSMAVHVHGHMNFILKLIRGNTIIDHWRPLDALYENWRSVLETGENFCLAPRQVEPQQPQV